MRRISLLLGILVLAAGIGSVPRHLQSKAATGGDFVHFESGHVHPAAMTPDGNRLLVVNTPDNRLTVFSLTDTVPLKIAEIPVGLEPVSVAALDNGTAWVVNLLSDDVSVVDLATMHVRTTLRVGDEPQDVVFAGTPAKAYVSVSTEDVIKVYDPATLALSATIAVSGRMPRALARNAAGTLVFASIFQAGNRTSVLSAAEVSPGLGEDPDFPRVASNKFGHPEHPGEPAPAPAVGAVIQYADGGSSGPGWYDEYGTFRNAAAPYTMHEVDVAEINTGTDTVSRNFRRMGSTTFSVAVNPVDGKLAVTGMEARNHLRYEPKIRGYLVETRLSYVSAGGTITNRILNPHITYFDLNGFVINPGTQAERDSAVSLPTGVAWAANGSRVYVTGFGNDKMAVINPAAGGSVSQMLARVPTVEGPTGVLVDDARGRIYVVGRNRNQLQTFSSDSLVQLAVTSIGFDPTPNEIVHGRRFFYGGFTSSHGDQSCATCHVFGDTDNLPWDLGDPAGAFVPPPNPNPFLLEGFDPEKGPMSTQTLRGMINTEPLHWRGDRVNLSAFNGAFASLLGLNALPDSQVTAFSAFVMPIAYPPNPYQFLNDSLPDAPPGTASARRGRVFFTSANVDGGKCADCHSLPTGTNQLMVPDNLLLADQDIKVPQLRNLYKKVGFTDAPGAVNKHGIAYTHDGAVDNLFSFLQFPLFNFGPPAVANDNRRDVEAFLLAFDTGMAPAVGFQVTFDGTPNPIGLLQVDTLEAVYTTNRCDIIAKGRVGNQPRGWMYVGSDMWDPDKVGEPNLTTAQMLALATGPGSELTVTGVPKGSGVRMGIDRDRDTYLDGDELDAGSNPGNPESTPINVGVRGGPREEGYAFEMLKPSLTRGPTEVVFRLGRGGRVDIEVYDLMGRQARVLARGAYFAAGQNRVTWDGRRDDGGALGAGIYFVRVRTEGGRWTRPLVMTR
ncbi:MAG: beta-propeller fold lactonase family protein [Candidatus Eiseniibacteriota bacterium]